VSYLRRRIAERAEWLKWRQDYVTASDAPALLELHPYVTPLQLWLDKAGKVPREARETPAMRRGTLLEPLAIELIRHERPNWRVETARDFWSDERHRLGGTPDAYIWDEDDRPGIVQVKSIEPSLFERSWRFDGEIVPPTWIGIQASLERHISGRHRAFIGALRVGHAVEFDLIEVPEVAGLIGRLESAADAFWQSIAANEPPPPQFGPDADLVRQFYGSADPGKTVDLSGSNRLPAMAEEDATLALVIKDAEARRKALKAELLYLMGDAELALVNGEVVATAKTVQQPAREVKAYSYRNVLFRRSKEPPV
jgi:predicted phage-related endonuclease